MSHRTLTSCYEKRKPVQLLWKIVWPDLVKLSISILNNPGLCCFWAHARRISCLCVLGSKHRSACSGVLPNSHKTGIPDGLSAVEWIDYSIFLSELQFSGEINRITDNMASVWVNFKDMLLRKTETYKRIHAVGFCLCKDPIQAPGYQASAGRGLVGRGSGAWASKALVIF